MTYDLSVAFDALVRAASVRGHGTEPLTAAAIAYVAQLAIDLGGYDAAILRQFEADLAAKVKARRELREAVKPVDFRPMGQVWGTSSGLVAAHPPLPGPEQVATVQRDTQERAARSKELATFVARDPFPRFAELETSLAGIGAQGQPDFDESVINEGNPLPDDEVHTLDALVEHEIDEP